MLSRGERKYRDGADVVLAIALQKFREARLLFRVADDEELLRLPDPTSWVAFDRRLAACDLFSGDTSFKNVETHDVLDGIVKDEREEVKINNGMEPAGKVVEERGEIALLGDSLADFKQGFELAPGVFERGGKRHFRRRDDGIRHRWQDSIWVGGGSTQAVIRGAANGSHYFRPSDQSWVRRQINYADKKVLLIEGWRFLR